MVGTNLPVTLNELFTEATDGHLADAISITDPGGTQVVAFTLRSGELLADVLTRIETDIDAITEIPNWTAALSSSGGGGGGTATQLQITQSGSVITLTFTEGDFSQVASDLFDATFGMAGDELSGWDSVSLNGTQQDWGSFLGNVFSNAGAVLNAADANSRTITWTPDLNFGTVTVPTAGDFYDSATDLSSFAINDSGIGSSVTYTATPAGPTDTITFTADNAGRFFNTDGTRQFWNVALTQGSGTTAGDLMVTNPTAATSRLSQLYSVAANFFNIIDGTSTRINSTATTPAGIATDFATAINAIPNILASSDGSEIRLIYPSSRYAVSSARALTLGQGANWTSGGITLAGPIAGNRDRSAAEKTPTTTQITSDTIATPTATAGDTVNTNNTLTIADYGVAAYDATAETSDVVRGHEAVTESMLTISIQLIETDSGTVRGSGMSTIGLGNNTNESGMVTLLQNALETNVFESFVTIESVVDDGITMSTRAFGSNVELRMSLTLDDQTVQNTLTSFIRDDFPTMTPSTFSGFNDLERPWLTDIFNLARQVVILASAKTITGSGFGFTFDAAPADTVGNTTAIVGTPYNSYVERIHNPLDGEVEYTKAAEHVQLLLSEGNTDILLGMTDSPGDLRNLYTDETGMAITSRTFFREEDYKTDWRRHGRLFNIRISDPTRVIDATTGLERPKYTAQNTAAGQEFAGMPIDPETGWRVAGYGVSAGREEARGGRARRN